MNNVFELVHSDCEKVVLKVNATDNLSIAMHPYISGEYDYITVTRGEDHVLTVVKKDGITFGFHWGRCGYTLISEGLEKLRKEVVDFIEDDCNIVLDATCLEATKAAIYYNDNVNRWQCSYRGVDNKAFIFWSKSVKDINKMLDKVSKLDVKLPESMEWIETKPRMWELIYKGDEE